MPVCESCLAALVPISAPRCAICGDVLVTGYRTQLGEARCNDCGRETPLFARATAYGAYDGGLREMVHLLKYQRVLPAANVLGRMLSEAIATLESELPAEVLVVPVPLHSSKLKQRGFNQSELIAEAAMREFKRHSKTLYSLTPKLLIRKRPTESQVGLTREQRQANVRGAFSVRHKEEIAQKHVLLVDDVFTTGTTVSECARVLLKAGAETVWVATVARALRATTTSVEGPAICGTQEREESALARHAGAL